MQLSTRLSTRSYLTAGVAVLGASAMAMAPVQALPERAADLPHRVVSGLDTTLLASSFDPITPWIDTVTTSIDNIAALIGFALEKPFPVLQTVIANIGTYFGELTSGNAGLIPGQIFSNVGKLFSAPFDSGQVGQLPIGPEGAGNTIPIPAGTYLSDTALPDGNSPFTLNAAFNQEIVSAVFGVPACEIDGECGIWPTVGAATTFLNSYGTGVLLGLLGPVLSPVAALINSVTAIVGAVSGGDFIGAINELVNIPANLVNGFLNGALLDLTPIVDAIGLDLPLDRIGFRLGGLISGPVPLNGSLTDPDNPPTEFSGGTGLDSLYAVVTTGLGTLNFPGLPTGPIGSLIGMGQYLSEQLVVTPPEAPAAQTAAAAEAPVEAPVEGAVEGEAPAVVEDSAPAAGPAAVSPVAEVSELSKAADPEPAAVSVTAARAGAGAESAPQTEAGADETAPAATRAGARAARTAPAAAGADTDAPAPRAAAAGRR